MGKLLRMFTAALALAALFLFGAAFAPATAFAQSAATGSVEGIVMDTTGAVLPGATVIVRNTGTNIQREAVSDSGGRYRASALQPGIYEVAATLAGFQAAPIENISVLVGQTQSIDVRMRPAGVTETVTVSGESPMIDTQRTDVSNVVAQQISYLVLIVDLDVQYWRGACDPGSTKTLIAKYVL